MPPQAYLKTGGGCFEFNVSPLPTSRAEAIDLWHEVYGVAALISALDPRPRQTVIFHRAG